MEIFSETSVSTYETSTRYHNWVEDSVRQSLIVEYAVWRRLCDGQTRPLDCCTPTPVTDLVPSLTLFRDDVTCSLTPCYWLQVSTQESSFRIPLEALTSFLDAFAKLLESTVNFIMSLYLSVCLPVCPHGSILLLLYGFAWILIFEYFSEIFRKNWSCFTIEQE